MSDRIDELVRRKRLIVCRDCSRDIPCTSCAPGQQFDELATIAREAEAMCEWLAGRATMIERELGKQPTWDSSDDWLKAASEAV